MKWKLPSVSQYNILIESNLKRHAKNVEKKLFDGLKMNQDRFYQTVNTLYMECVILIKGK